MGIHDVLGNILTDEKKTCKKVQNYICMHNLRSQNAIYTMIIKPRLEKWTENPLVELREDKL